MFKVCKKCGNRLSLSEFSTRSNAKDGLNYYCKGCVKEYAQQHYLQNREKKLQQNRDWYNANKDSRNKQIAEYQRARPEWRRALDKKSYQKHREKRIQKSKKWIQDHPEKHAFRVICERTISLGLPLDYQMSDWENALTFFEHRCAYCGSKPKVLEKEHIVALANKGHTVPANIIPACQRCNRSKKIKSLETWFPHQKFFSAERLQKIREYQTRIARPGG